MTDNSISTGTGKPLNLTIPINITDDVSIIANIGIDDATAIADEQINKLKIDTATIGLKLLF